MKIIRPMLISILFVVLVVYFTYYFKSTTLLSLFISSPFNMTTEANSAGDLTYNLIFPAVLIFIIGVYLKNYNKAFQKKCSLRAVFLMAILASYIKSIGSLIYYKNYADFGISLGTSVITLCFVVVFVISLEVYIRNKEEIEHLYGGFLFSIMSVLVLLLGVLIFFSVFTMSSLLVHLMGVVSFIIVFVPYYERKNISKFVRKEEKKLTKPMHLSASR